MEYQALYRKYRPQSFADVVGQQHVTETLVREVAEGRVAHAYLFAGPRGTGKTTSARILAKALNCLESPGTGIPCNQCSSCVAIGTGSSFDVTELDAASHNSVDDIREIRVSVTTVAAQGGKRVFILDEAHMLSKAAGNALLKTLEEPPEHVHFVLATTEPYKLLDTIRSRSQRFDFHPITIDDLVGHLATISDREGFTVEGDALTAIARHARGSARDALSLLEQVAALGDGTIDEASVNRALGLADRDVYLHLARAVAESDATAALETVARLAAAGVDLRRFVAETIGFFRGVFLTQFASEVEHIVDEPAETVADWRTVGEQLSPSDVTRVIDLLTEGLIRLREGREERLMVEMALLKVVRPELAADPASLAARIEKLEQRINRVARDLKEHGLDEPGGGRPSAGTPEPATAPRSASDGKPATEPRVAAVPDPEPADGPAAAPEPVLTDESGDARPQAGAPEPATVPSSAPAPPSESGASASVSLQDVERAWPALMAQVRDELGLRREALLREARPGRVDGSVASFYLPSHLGFHLQQLQEDHRVAAVMAEKAQALFGTALDIRFEFEPEGDAPTVAEDEPLPRKEDLVETAEANDDAVNLVADILGGEVIEESGESAV